MPLGAEGRWSLMGEWCSPWYVWQHNSRAYELLQVGLELRRWTTPRCAPCRTVLTGGFWGLYALVGKNDFEWRSKGNQGEFLSGGVTLGHSWYLGRHWNLEASLGLGVAWGERRHYHGEFSDTHLIWRETHNTFYAGPTKLKLSLVWLLPNWWNRQKGGAL